MFQELSAAHPQPNICSPQMKPLLIVLEQDFTSLYMQKMNKNHTQNSWGGKKKNKLEWVFVNEKCHVENRKPDATRNQLIFAAEHQLMHSSVLQAGRQTAFE